MRIGVTRSVIAASAVVLAAAAHAHTAAVSAATDPTNGYPLWCQDASTPGIRLEPCLDSKDPFCVLLADLGFNPANPVVFPSNFPTEFFYVVADSDKLSTPGCPASGIAPGLAKYQAAVEGTFLNGVVEPGQQSTFARTKIVVSGLCPNTTYTFTTPYGADAVTDAAGAVVANKKGATIDIGCAAAPCNLSAALASRVFGSFLRFDPAFTAPPPGYLGDNGPAAGTLTRIIGSPIGTNLFSITGPAGKVLASGWPASGIGPGKAKCRAAVEGSFVNGVQAWGDQSAFARTRRPTLPADLSPTRRAPPLTPAVWARGATFPSR